MNNASNVALALLILDNKMTIEDVPAQLQAGVSEVVAYFTKTTQSTATEPAAVEPASQTAPVDTAPESDAKTVTVEDTPTEA